MRSFLFASLLLSTACVCSVPALAQAPGNYDSQKATLKATRVDSLQELRGQGRALVGKTIELRGQTRGSFARGGNLAVILSLLDEQTVVVEVPGALRDSAITRPGTPVRVLCKVTSMDGIDPGLLAQSATDQPENSPLVKSDDDNGPVVMAPSDLSPMPGEGAILMGSEAALPASRPATLSSRGSTLPRGATSNLTPGANRSVGNPYYGFSGNTRAAFKAMAQRYNRRLRDDMADYIAASILAAAQNNNLDPRFLAAVVQVESSFDPYCVSSAGAMGLGQLMPFNLRPLGVANAWDPAQNLNGAAKMLRRNLDTYSRFQNGTLLAVAAYHAGVGAVNRAGYKVPKVSTNRYAWKVYYAYRALAPELFEG